MTPGSSQVAVVQPAGPVAPLVVGREASLTRRESRALAEARLIGAALAFVRASSEGGTGSPAHRLGQLAAALGRLAQAAQELEAAERGS